MAGQIHLAFWPERNAREDSSATMMIQQIGLLGAVDFGVWDALRDVLLLLLVALLFGTIAERLRQSVIVGYLIAGTV